ncbi:rRNA maturation RNase YbeY [bacterium]|nr:rRNA maturation RNase YbeY [bacterium]
MVQINVFVENTYENYEIDEVKAYDNALKITNFLFAQDEVMKDSCLAGEEYEQVFFDIVFMNNEEIHTVNKEYRKKDAPTDVITFAMFADSPQEERYIFDGEVHLGEIMVSLDKIEEQAKENNVSFEEELHYIIAHGVLHLLGFDHQTEPEYNFMVDYQNRAKAIVND